MGELITVASLFKAGASVAFQQLQAKRLEDARRILLKRMKKGEHWAIQDDKAAAALFSYIRAAQEGAARMNLDLLAQAIAGKADEKTFAPDEFRRWARVLSELTRDEVLVLAGLLKAEKQSAENARTGEGTQNIGDLCVEAMSREGGPFKTPKEVRSYLCALMRTGFVEPVAYFGEMGFVPTTALHLVAQMVSFEEALQEAENAEL